MSRKYEQVELTQRQCVELKCDVCGAVAEELDVNAWRFGGEYTTQIDVCSDCRTYLVAAIVCNGEPLRKLIGRELDNE